MSNSSPLKLTRIYFGSSNKLFLLNELMTTKELKDLLVSAFKLNSNDTISGLKDLKSQTKFSLRNFLDSFHDLKSNEFLLNVRDIEDSEDDDETMEKDVYFFISELSASGDITKTEFEFLANELSNEFSVIEDAYDRMKQNESKFILFIDNYINRYKLEQTRQLLLFIKEWLNNGSISMYYYMIITDIILSKSDTLEKLLLINNNLNQSEYKKELFKTIEEQLFHRAYLQNVIVPLVICLLKDNAISNKDYNLILELLETGSPELSEIIERFIKKPDITVLSNELIFILQFKSPIHKNHTVRIIENDGRCRSELMDDIEYMKGLKGSERLKMVKYLKRQDPKAKQLEREYQLSSNHNEFIEKIVNFLDYKKNDCNRFKNLLYTLESNGIISFDENVAIYKIYKRCDKDLLLYWDEFKQDKIFEKIVQHLKSFFTESKGEISLLNYLIKLNNENKIIKNAIGYIMELYDCKDRTICESWEKYIKDKNEEDLLVSISNRIKYKYPSFLLSRKQREKIIFIKDIRGLDIKNKDILIECIEQNDENTIRLFAGEPKKLIPSLIEISEKYKQGLDGITQLRNTLYNLPFSNKSKAILDDLLMERNNALLAAVF